MYLVVALYQFSYFETYESYRDGLMHICNEWEIKGTLILAAEGINGTIAGPEKNVRKLLHYLQQIPEFTNLEWKESWSDEQPFYRMKVKLKREIVTLGQKDADPRQKVGTYVEPKDWNALISDPDVVVIDTRNDYECQLGTFKGAVNPDLETFREFPEYVSENLDPQKHRKVAMFCTGGIRCEKASAYMLQHGFKEVYHLHGGILKYLEEVAKEQSLWEGECFVFDNRVSVTHDLQRGTFDLCPSCRIPLSDELKRGEKYEEGVHCPACFDELTPERIASLRERHHQIQLAKERGEQHLGLTLDEKRARKKAERQKSAAKS